jgi:hypothetical protein
MLFGGDFNDTRGDCFQVLGFDIFLDKHLKPWVLEVNDHPSMNINLEFKGEDGTTVKIPSEIDKHIKVKVIGDAIKFMHKFKKGNRHKVEQYRTFHSILPCEEAEYFDVFINLK